MKTPNLAPNGITSQERRDQQDYRLTKMDVEHVLDGIPHLMFRRVIGFWDENDEFVESKRETFDASRTVFSYYSLDELMSTYNIDDDDLDDYVKQIAENGWSTFDSNTIDDIRNICDLAVSNGIIDASHDPVSISQSGFVDDDALVAFLDWYRGFCNEFDAEHITEVKEYVRYEFDLQAVRSMEDAIADVVCLYCPDSEMIGKALKDVAERFRVSL